MTWKTTRYWTNRLLDAVDEGAVEVDWALRMCLQYMSEDDVKDMCRVNDILQEDDDGSSK